MYVCSTNLQGPQSIPKFEVAICEVLLSCLTCSFDSLDLCLILQFQFLVGILMMEKMSQNANA